MASEGGVVLGSFLDASGTEVLAVREQDGTVTLRSPWTFIEIPAAELPIVSELLDRAAMPGQPADGGPPAGEARDGA